MAPRRTLPYWRSHSSSDGNAALQAQFFGIAGVDAGDKRRDEIFQNFVAEFSAHETSATDSSSVGGLRFALKGSEAIFQREPDAEQGRRQQRLRRHGNFPQAAVQQDVARRARIGFLQFALRCRARGSDRAARRVP